MIFKKNTVAVIVATSEYWWQPIWANMDNIVMKCIVISLWQSRFIFCVHAVTYKQACIDPLVVVAITGSDMQEVIGTAIAFYLLSNGK